MSELKDVITSYNNLSFSDRIVFYTTISNDIAISDDTQSFLIETRLDGEGSCIYCEGMHVVKNGKRKDGVQRFLCRDCHRSFIASTDSITSRTRKSISVWATYLKCMLDQKTLKQSSAECDISISTAFTWRHKILDTLSELTEKAYLTGVVEADETFFNVSFKGNHNRSRDFSITSQNFSIDEDDRITMPGFIKEIKLKAKHRSVRQIRIKTDKNSIRIMLMYEQETESIGSDGNIMGIDLGVDNLVTASLSSGGTPFIINGRPLKSINRYYNKRKGLLQEIAKRSNRLDITNRMERLTEKRNNKVKDYLHQASRKIIELAKTSNVNHICIGNNRGWKQKVELGKRTNQTFVSIPYRMLIDMIRYKAELIGIKVSVVKESYTSGTSYLDGEIPEKNFYDATRRVKRGMFKSNKGTLINADVNAAYQIIKAGGYKNLPIKEKEKVIRLNVA